MTLPRTADVVIVGAGVGGLAAARELAARSVGRIVVLERDYPGSGATGRNVARIRRMQLTEDLSRVAMACQDKYERMGAELRSNVLFYRLGYAWILYEEDEVERMRDVVAMHARLGIRSALLSPDDTLRHLPVFEGGEPVAGSVLSDDAIVHHDAVVWAHLDHLGRRWSQDVTVHPHTRVTGIERDDSHVRAVLTDQGRIETPVMLNAAGGWSGELNALAGVRMPNRPHRREVLVTAPLRRSIEAAVTFYRPSEGWFNQTLRGEVVMGAVDPDEPAGINQRSSWAFLQRTAALMTRKAPALRDVTVIRQWGGMYDITPDHLPIIGPTEQLEGWWQALGWSGRGMLLAPYLAELLADHLVSGEPPAMLRQFLPDRFPRTSDDAAPLETDYYSRYASGSRSGSTSAVAPPASTTTSSGNTTSNPGA
ncbi:MAG TPA: FAD-binding oxidoreductase [Candidatus Limnocylindrales bacterium]|nr:FAD-binding oxidoreductase [Candidatus Limnocylindrales bacterium]